MKRIRLRSGLATLAVLIVAGVAWFYFAPTNIGGSTRYVVTSGVSMEPRFHTGDLAIVRPASNYRIGEIVAYWSTLLHTVVLHRIIARDGNRYVFKGDNNHFIDPVRPTRSELLGKLWLHVPHLGRVLKMLHTRVVAALLCAVVGLLTLVGVKENRRRRRRRKGGAGSSRRGIPIVNSPRDQHPFNFGALFTASAVAAVALLVVAMIAFTRPASKVVPTSTPYTQRVTFGYSAHVRPGLVYPSGNVTTGDPIFLSLVRDVGVSIDYRLSADTPTALTGTEDVLLELTGPSGWTHNLVLVPTTHFTGTHAGTEVTLDVPRLQSLLDKVSGMIGGGTGAGSYTISVVPRVRVKGAVAGHPVSSTIAPALSFALSPTQLVPNGVAAGASSAAGSGVTPGAAPRVGFSQTASGAVVGHPGSAPTTLTVLGVSPTISLLRWLALIGLLLSVPTAVYAFLRKRGERFEESVKIQAQYGHLIVPIVAGEDLGWPPVDVPSIKSLVRLAESGQRLILHTRSGNVDTYLVNDEGTVYRYQVKPSKVIWGEWTDAPVPAQDAAPSAHDAANAA